jgi:hypothetical protein
VKRATAWNKANPERRNATSRKHAWKRQGIAITMEDFQRRLLEQGGRCAMCGTDKPGARDWCVDHDHASGHIRGLLCHTCNMLLGLAKDSTSRLLAGVKYLQKHQLEEAA